MKKRILLVAAFASVVAMANSQNLVDGNKTWDNWSIGINAGGVTPLTHHAFINSMRPTVGLELSNQLTPVFGVGLEGMLNFNTSTSKTVVDAGNLSLLGKVNLNNLIGGFKGTPRFFETEVVGGIGWGHAFLNGDETLTSKVGLNFNFNLGQEKAWTIAVKPALVYNLQGEQSSVRFNANHATVELTAGLVYHFKNSNGKHHMTLTKAYNQAEIDDLNAKVNAARSDAQNKSSQLGTANQRISDLERQLNDCKNQKQVVVETVKETSQTLESVVTFNQGKAVVSASQLPNVQRIATYLKSRPDSKVVIKGYTSPEGSLEANERLAKQRAEAVKSILVNKYKIAADRVEAEGQGVGKMFEEAEWNRVSICTITK